MTGEPGWPALTAEEWRAREFESRYGVVESTLGVDHKGRLTVLTEEATEEVTLNEASNSGALHKTAALCLYGQPFGFTREDCGMLRSFAMDARRNGRHARADTFEGLADRIAALLPPE